MEEKDSVNKKTIDLLHSTNPTAQRALARKAPHGHSFAQQLRALLCKRAQSAPRDLRALMFTFVLPLLFVAGAIVVAKTLPSNIHFEQNTTPLQMGFWEGARVAAQGGDEVLSWSQVPTDTFVQVSSNWTMSNFINKYL